MGISFPFQIPFQLTSQISLEVDSCSIQKIKQETALKQPDREIYNLDFNEPLLTFSLHSPDAQTSSNRCKREPTVALISKLRGGQSPFKRNEVNELLFFGSLSISSATAFCPLILPAPSSAKSTYRWRCSEHSL